MFRYYNCKPIMTKEEVIMISLTTLKPEFDKAYSYAQMLTTCNKVAVGAIFVTGDKRIYSCNRNNDGYSCIVNNSCYKASVTGKYESCEETRKFCKATHAEVNLIESSKFKSLKSNEIENGILYLTRYPCLNCMEKIAESGIQTVYYCGTQEASDEVKNIAESKGILLTHYDQCDYEDRLHENWWTNDFYEKAYEVIEPDKKYPIVIPSYNRPRLKSVNTGFLSNMDEEHNYPIYIFVRESQKEEYENNLTNKYASIISYPDKVISNAGAVRRIMLKWLSQNGYKAAFSFDDDLLDIGHTERQYTQKGDPKAGRNKSHSNISKLLAMWQLSMDKAIQDYNILISGVMPEAFSWKPEYCMSSQSMLFNRGLPSQAVCLNVEGLVAAGLTYYDNSQCGHEDIDLTIRVIDSGNNICVFPFLAHNAPAMSIENWDFKDINERFAHQQEIMMRNHGDKEWVRFRDKRGLAQVTISWPQVRKFRGIKEYIFDIWNSGELIGGSNK